MREDMMSQKFNETNLHRKNRWGLELIHEASQKFVFITLLLLESQISFICFNH